MLDRMIFYDKKIMKKQKKQKKEMFGSIII